VRFDGRHDALVLKPLSAGLAKALHDAWTLELDVCFHALPNELDAAYPVVFEAMDQEGKAALTLRGNKTGRYEVAFATAGAAKGSFLCVMSSEQNGLGLVRGEWVRAALTVDPGNWVRFFVNGEMLGARKLPGPLPGIAELRFAGDPAQAWRLFRGAVDNVRITPGILHDENTDAEALNQRRRRQREASFAEWSPLLRPERPEWAERHPRLILTPAALADLKLRLQLGRGPELLERLIAECEAWLDPESETYYAPQTYGLFQDRYVHMTPALLCLGTLLSDNPKYAKRAAELVAAYADHIGYDRVTHHFVNSAGAAGTSMMMALSYDWGYPHFTVEQRLKVREALVEIAAGAHDNLTEPANRRFWVANWSAMGVSTLGHASLAIIGEANAPASKWLNAAQRFASEYANFAVGRDGAFNEGSAYLFYGAGY